MPAFFNFSEGYTLIVVAGGAALLGAISGLVGTLAVLKKQSLLADAVSHACLPGIVLAFIIIGTKSHSMLLAGAAVAGIFAAVQMMLLARKGNIRQDSTLSLTLSVYFAFGIVLLSRIQHNPGSAQAGIETFLFGEAATILISDVYIIAAIGTLICFLLLLFWKELFLVAFDPVYASASGLSVVKLDILFLILVTGSVVIGLQTVGVVLMSALLVAPAAAARQWTNHIRGILLLGMIFGAFSGLCGSVLSSFIPGLPTGPTIIVCISLIALFSFFFAPARGIVWARRKKAHKQESADHFIILEALYMLSLQHTGETRYGHSTAIIHSIFPLKKNTDELLAKLHRKGLADKTAPDKWAITPAGAEYIETHQKKTAPTKASHD